MLQMLLVTDNLPEVQVNRWPAEFFDVRRSKLRATGRHAGLFDRPVLDGTRGPMQYSKDAQCAHHRPTEAKSSFILTRLCSIVQA